VEPADKRQLTYATISVDELIGGVCKRTTAPQRKLKSSRDAFLFGLLI